MVPKDAGLRRSPERLHPRDQRQGGLLDTVSVLFLSAFPQTALKTLDRQTDVGAAVRMLDNSFPREQPKSDQTTKNSRSISFLGEQN